MGLSIHTNLYSLDALTSLRSISRLLSLSSERLASQRRINHAADDPSGVGFVARARAQVMGLERAGTNTQLGINFLKTVDDALDQIGQRIGNISSAILASDQASIDSALEAIDQIASATTFAGKTPLRGLSALSPSTPDSRIRQLEVRRASFTGSTLGLSITVNTAPTRASFTIDVASGPLTAEVTGPFGTGTISLAGGEATPIPDLLNQLDALRGTLGLDSNSGANPVRSLTFGASSTLTVRRVSGTGTLTVSGTALANGDSLGFAGADASITVNGRSAATDGDRVNATSLDMALRFRIDPTVLAGTTINLSLARGGETFQLGSTGHPRDRLTLGIPMVGTGSLGRQPLVETSAVTTYFGFLSSLATGGDNDLASDSANAARIADAAADQVSSLRAFVGSIISRVLEPNLSLTERVSAEVDEARSRVEDLDFAAETAEFTRMQVLFEAATSVVAQANLIPSQVLRLLPFPKAG
ncbi:MAG: hypothetical protein HY722_05440 [Planctomycetes bacterium]|nr:hypothetical protein [Planctomycetota bacterium]